MNTPYSPLRVYVAAPFEARDAALDLKRQLEERGVVVTSTWLTPADGNESNMANLKESFDSCRCRAIQDLRDINGADWFILYKPKALHRVPTTGGHHVETGYAVSKGKPIVIYGERENVFHYLPGVFETDHFDSLLKLLNVEEES